LADELEHASLLRIAESIAGLFASGAITHPLGATAQLIAEFWIRRFPPPSPKFHHTLSELA
jgi:hypothetical protein